MFSRLSEKPTTIRVPRRRRARNKQVFLDGPEFPEATVNMTGRSKGKDPAGASDSSDSEFSLGLKGIFVEPDGIYQHTRI